MKDMTHTEHDVIADVTIHADHGTSHGVSTDVSANLADIVTIAEAVERQGTSCPTRQSYHDAIKRKDLRIVPGPDKTLRLRWSEIVAYRARGGFKTRAKPGKNVAVIPGKKVGRKAGLSAPTQSTSPPSAPPPSGPTPEPPVAALPDPTGGTGGIVVEVIQIETGLTGSEVDDQPLAVNDLTDFESLDKVVRDGLETFADVGNALREIRDRQLWRVGGYASWAVYCETVGALTKQHVNRLIKSSGVFGYLTRVEPIGSTLPRTESQVRPLSTLNDPNQQVAAWHSAVEQAGGKQPTAKMVNDAVAEIDPKKKSQPSSKQLLASAFGHLEEAVSERKPYDDIERLVTDIKKLLKLS